MKKLFVIVFTLAILFSSFITRAEATTTGTDQADNSTLTIEVMEKLLSWEDLVNRSKTVASEEDYYVKMLIEGIDAVGNNMSYSVGGIRLEDVEYDRLMQKFQRVIDLYSLEYSLQLQMTPKILSEFIMQITVETVKIEKWGSLEIGIAFLIVVLSYYMCSYYFQQKQKKGINWLG